MAASVTGCSGAWIVPRGSVPSLVFVISICCVGCVTTGREIFPPPGVTKGDTSVECCHTGHLSIADAIVKGGVSFTTLDLDLFFLRFFWIELKQGG